MVTASRRLLPAAPVAVIHTRESFCRCHDALHGALRALRLPFFTVPVEDLPRRLPDLDRAALVFEHSDRLRGEAFLRGFLRFEIERRGLLTAGASARSAALADDKILSLARLAARGLPVPRSVTATDIPRRRPAELRFPLIVKTAFDHGSRGVALVTSSEDLASAARRFLDEGAGPLLLQEFLPGRELTVSLLGHPLRTLPPVAVALPRLTDGTTAVYTFHRKWTGSSRTDAARHRAVPAVLTPAERSRILPMARRAALALGLRDYARIDVRFDAEGRPRILEANARPSLEPGSFFASAAALDGLSLPAAVAEIIGSALRRRRTPRPPRATADGRARA